MIDGEIYLGDLIRALALLRPEGEAEQEAILVLLGFERRREASEVSNILTFTPIPSPGAVATVSEPPTLQARATQLRAMPSDARSESDENRSVSAELEVETFPLASFAQVDESVGSLVAEPSEVVIPLPDPEPPLALLPRSTLRALLAELLSTEQEAGSIDMVQAVRRIAGGKSLLRLPRARVRTLARGADVLFDYGPSLVPFSHDRRQLLRDLEQIFGSSRLSFFYFRDCPARGVSERPGSRCSRYEPSRRGRPVLLVTDLGIGRPPLSPTVADPREWRAFFLRLAAGGCSIRALVPYPQSRWPPQLAREIAISVWDRTVTVQAVRRSIRYERDVQS